MCTSRAVFVITVDGIARFQPLTATHDCSDVCDWKKRTKVDKLIYTTEDAISLFCKQCDGSLSILRTGPPHGVIDRGDGSDLNSNYVIIFSPSCLTYSLARAFVARVKSPALHSRHIVTLRYSVVQWNIRETRIGLGYTCSIFLKSKRQAAHIVVMKNKYWHGLNWTTGMRDK